MVGSLVLGLYFALVLRLCSREGVEAWVALPLAGWFGSPWTSQSRCWLPLEVVVVRAFD